MHTTLNLRGMSCASCAARIEKALATHPGVTAATVNFATATAGVEHALAPDELVRVVEEAGYEAMLADAPAAPGASSAARGGAPGASLHAPGASQAGQGAAQAGRGAFPAAEGEASGAPTRPAS